MNIAHKLTLALTLGISAVMAGNTYFRVQRETALFEDDQASDHRAMGRDLRAVVQASWQTDGEATARRLVEGTNSTTDLEIHWTWLDELGGGTLRPPLSANQLRALAGGQEISLVRRDQSDSARRYTYVPMSIAGARAAAIELSEVPSPPPSFIGRSMEQNALETLVIVTLCSSIAMGLGSWFVGRPMRRLCEKARRVGLGDFSGRIDLDRRDEIGELAAEIDTTCDRLAEANRRVAAETEARIAALEQLRHAERLKTVGQLGAGLAHELGTPLNVISGRATMIGGGDLAADEVAKSARVIVEQAERMTAIIRQVLDFSRRRGPRFAAGDLRRVVGQALEMLSSVAEKRGVTVCLDERAEPTLVHMDESQILQTLTNLILNGIQAMPLGGRLTVALARQRLRPPPDHGGPEETYVRVTVEDEGDGIAPDVIPHVFEPFFTTKGVGEGTGLGLSVAYGIVHEHGGWIDVESTVGEGSRFSVFLRPAENPLGHAEAGEEVA